MREDSFCLTYSLGVKDEDHILLDLVEGQDLESVQKYAIRSVLLEAETHYNNYKFPVNQISISSCSLPSLWPSSLDSLE